jgi:hypothetical protein
MKIIYTKVRNILRTDYIKDIMTINVLEKDNIEMQMNV